MDELYAVIIEKAHEFYVRLRENARCTKKTKLQTEDSSIPEHPSLHESASKIEDALTRLKQSSNLTNLDAPQQAELKQELNGFISSLSQLQEQLQ